MGLTRIRVLLHNIVNKLFGGFRRFQSLGKSGKERYALLYQLVRMYRLTFPLRHFRFRLSAIFRPQRLVLHPGSRPVPEEERSERERCAANSICRLSLAAKEIGAVLCVENMPHSIGRTSAEMLRLIGGCTEAMVCFDTNHLLLESHADFIGALGDRIATVHLSDYDGRDERHWLPGRGVIDWPDLCRRLRRTGYRGVYIFEGHHAATS